MDADLCPTKGLLAMESFREAFAAQLDFGHSSRPDHDLRGLIRSLARAHSGPAGRLAASVLAEAQSDAAVQTEFLENFSEPLRRRSAEVLRAGVDAGRFREGLDIHRMLDAVVGAVYLRLIFGLPLDESWADDLSSTLLQGCLR